MNVSEMRDLGSYIKTVFQGYVDSVAGGAGDNTEKDGVWIDRTGYESLVAAIAWQATLADGETFSLTANLQHADSAAGANAADYGTAYAKTVQVTNSGGGNESGVLELDFDLSDAKQFVRLQFTPDLSAANTDIADIIATLIMGGAVEVPAA